jgi:predicted pyridoxine 5'-phosphate oxidase superfamily flavin-nucleotide-binding protein
VSQKFDSSAWRPAGGESCRLTAVGSRGERALQREFGTEQRANRFYDTQMLDYLNKRMIEFVCRQEMLFVATADANGECDATFRAGPPGFIRVFDYATVGYPEYRGNGVMASLGNISENGHVGLLMIDFIEDLIGLHINGTAEIVADDVLQNQYDLTDVQNPGRHAPERWVKVNVVEAYIHCAKHIPRFARQPRTRQWGTDDSVRKKSDYFDTASSKSA